MAWLLLVCGSAVGEGTDDGGAEAGKWAVDALPIERALEQARKDFGGRVLEVELEREKRGSAGYVYEVKLLTVDGRVVKVEYDAHTLEQVRVRGGRRNRPDARHDD